MHSLFKHRRCRRWALLGFGWTCVGFAALGAMLPVLPTTPFLLLAAWAFSKSSQRLAGWLYRHRRFGPVLRNWFAGLPLPLLPVQLLWLNLVTNGIQDVALAFEKAEPGILKRPPRSPAQPIFDRQMIRQTLLSGGYIGTVAFAVYYYLIEYAGMNEFDARNLLLLLMVLFENAHIFSCRSETRSLLRVPLASNWLLIIAVILAQGVHITAMYIPGISDVLQIEPVAPGIWMALLPIAALLVFDEAAKWLHRR